MAEQPYKAICRDGSGYLTEPTATTISSSGKIRGMNELLEMEHYKDALARLIGGRGCIRLCDGQSGSRKNRSACVRPSLRGLCGALQ
eukprot:scaffold143955_cov46-Cyclotella_meneghiniana.AAC.1